MRRIFDGKAYDTERMNRLLHKETVSRDEEGREWRTVVSLYQAAPSMPGVTQGHYFGYRRSDDQGGRELMWPIASVGPVLVDWAASEFDHDEVIEALKLPIA